MTKKKLLTKKILQKKKKNATPIAPVFQPKLYSALSNWYFSLKLITVNYLDSIVLSIDGFAKRYFL